MAIFRGIGGAGDSADNAYLQAITDLADDAEQSRLGAQNALNFAISAQIAANQSAENASASADSILNLTVATGAAGTEASYDASTGVLTVPRGESGAADAASVSAAGAVMDSDFTANGFMKRTGAGAYTVDTNTYLTSHQDISGKANLTGANFTGAVNVTGGDVEIGTLIANQNLNVFGNIAVSGTVDGVDLGTVLTDGDFASNGLMKRTAAGTYGIDSSTYLTAHQDISGKANLSGADFTGNVTVDTNVLYVDTTQDRVGINQGTPAEALDVTGNIKASGTLIMGEGATSALMLNPKSGTYHGTQIHDNGAGFEVWVDGNTNNASSSLLFHYTTSNNTLSCYQPFHVVSDITLTGTVDGVDIASLDTTVAGKADLSGADFTGNVNIGIPPSGTQTLNVAGVTNLYGGADLKNANITNVDTLTAQNVNISKAGGVTTNIATGSNTAGTDIKTVNIGTGFTNGGTTHINIGSISQTTTCTTNINNAFNVNDVAYLNDIVEFKSNASQTGDYDQLVSFRAKSGAGTWQEAGRVSVRGQSSSPANFVIGVDKAALRYFDGFGSRVITPADADTANGTDAICDLGSYWNRFRIGKFSSGTSTTSDGREKRNIEELNEAELRVATRCKSLLRKYQRTEALELKGDDARLHFGIIAQDLEQAFADEGLDANRYAMFLEDTWYVTEEDGEIYPVLEAVPEELRESAVQKSLKGIRYEQLLAFIIAAI